VFDAIYTRADRPASIGAPAAGRRVSTRPPRPRFLNNVRVLDQVEIYHE
jgi:hypothetical protein